MATNFGRDISCTTSLRTGRYASGPRLVAEASYRRVDTPRGMLHGDEDEQNYGIDLAGMIGSVRTKSDAAAVEGRVRSELTKDERILSVKVTVTETKDGPKTSWRIAIDGMTAEGPFSLQVGVDGVTVELLNLSVEEG